MNLKKLLFLFTTSLLFIYNPAVFSQTTNTNISPKISGDEDPENIYNQWSLSLDKARIRSGSSEEDFIVFTRFSEKALDSLRGDFIKHIGDKTVTMANSETYESVLTNAILSLYKKYQTIEQLYPSSVEEFRNYNPDKLISAAPANTGCNNIDFSSGNLSGWNAYYGTDYTSTVTTQVISNVVGGPAGAVTHAANDILTSTTYYVINSCNTCVGNPNPDYQINLTSGSRGDAIIPSIPVVSPYGGQYSVMVGDSTLVNSGVAILSQTFQVTQSNENFTYQYAVFLGTTNPAHKPSQQPFLKIEVLDSVGTPIPTCGDYNVVSGSGTSSFDSTEYVNPFSGNTVAEKVYYKNWTIVDVPLKKYLGHPVTIMFETGDCGPGGHFGYAYVSASCGPNEITSSSPNLCGQDSITLTAPPGGAHYIWSGPTHGIIGSSTSQTVAVDSSGVYQVIVVPVTGLSCADTLYDTVGRLPGPPPFPNFHALSTCAGEETQFINTSSDTTSAHFYWDFYNIGVYNDSNIVNPTWIYTTPGTYTVKLDEVYNGCGVDTIITIHIGTPISGNFAVSNACAGSVITMPITITGATNYLWNYGDPASGASNTSTAANGSHTYANAGTYTITLLATNSGSCRDSIAQHITIYAVPTPVITGKDSVCPNYIDTLKATGGTTYSWNGAATTTTATFISTSATTQTITLTAYNGICSHDTTFILHRVSLTPVITASKDSICPGTSVVLTAGGGINYRWSNNNTSSSITVSPTANTSYTLYTTIGNCIDSTTITIYLLQGITCTLHVSHDSICKGASTTISVNATGGNNFTYTWSTGQTTSSISPAPIVSTLYTVEVSNGSCSLDTAINIVVKPAPILINSSPVDTVCFGNSVELDVSGALSYSWAPPNGLNCTACSSPIAYPTTSITYTVTGSDADGCTATSNIFVLVETRPVLNPIPSVHTCGGNAVTLTASEDSGFNGTFTWEPSGSHNPSITVTPFSTVTYTVQYKNLCGTTDTTVTIYVNPTPIPTFSADITNGCAPLCVQFRNLSTILSNGTISMWSWSFGNGSTVNEESPIYCYSDTGSYTPALTVVSSNGCSATLQINQMITVYSNPVANFTYAPQPINILNPIVQFTDNSTDKYGIAYWNWRFGDATDINNTKNPTHTYKDTGVYCAQLVVENNKGCIDTSIECLDVEPIFSFYIPTSFSPNGDGLNDVFEPKGDYVKNFEMYIFDRWGMEIYHTTDITKGWNGKVNGHSAIAMEDSYVYKISATDEFDNAHTYTGVVTLLK